MFPTAPEFQHVFRSSVELNRTIGPQSLAELVFQETPDEDDAVPIIEGTIGDARLTVSLRSFRHAVIVLSRAFRRLGLAPGDYVCLARLPRTSESLAALVYGALAATGYRVLFPMYLEPTAFADWLTTTNAKAVFWASGEVMEKNDREEDQVLLRKLEAAAQGVGLPTYCFEENLNLHTLLEEPAAKHDCAEMRQIYADSAMQDVNLILTTSGTSGRAKLVSYRQSAFLASCRSWTAAGLFSPERLGGRGLCLLLAHSMGLRAFWNAIWTRQALCLLPPEWFFEHPDRVMALLSEMKPEHVTGGPAAFHTLLELGRIFPDLKDTCFQHLRCGVSSGGSFDAELGHRVWDLLGVRLENGFGMTETMQVLNTLTEGPLVQGHGLLGNPLPGVEIGLERVTDESAYRLWVRSPFGFACYVQGEGLDGSYDRRPDGWFYTGDLVEYADDGLKYLRREATDFCKDSFGVKMSYALLRERYQDLDRAVSHIEFFPLEREPGLAALIFVNHSMNDAALDEAGSAVIGAQQLSRWIRGCIEARHESLLGSIDDFEMRHLTIARFYCIDEPPPKTAKGSVSRERIESQHREILERLRGRLVRGAGVVAVKRERLFHRATARLSSPRLGEMLELANLDKEYVRAAGDYLYYEKGKEQRKVLDLVGGFGMNLFGHRHPALIKAAQEFASGSAPWIGDQGSARRGEGELAKALSQAVGNSTGQSYVVKFGSTGTEAVEIALAHAFLERQERWNKFGQAQQRQFGARAPHLLAQVLAAAEAIFSATPPRVLVFKGGFHGNSLGTRALRDGKNSRIYHPMARLVRLELPARREEFRNPQSSFDLEALIAENDLRLPALVDQEGVIVESEKRVSSIIAAIYEPLQGEGGIDEPDPLIVRQLQNQEFPLIADEIQCGLGRTGSFLASEGIHADYYLFAKALGGGIAKISATLIERSRYVDLFDEHCATTFGGDGFSCAIARTVLDLIEREQAPERAASQGELIRKKLMSVAKAHPEVIRNISGRGLMLGIHFNPAVGDRMLSFRLAERHKLLGLEIASYLLNRHDLRMLPTLSASNTLRVEPSIYISDQDIDWLTQGLTAFCMAAERGDSAELLGCMVEDELHMPGAQFEDSLPCFSIKLDRPTAGSRRVAFLTHLVQPDRELAMLDPGLRILSKSARLALLDKCYTLTDMKPTPLMARNLFDGRVWFSVILIGSDTATVEEMNRSRKRDRLIQRIQEGVKLAAEQGCELLTLGAHTSIVTGDGTALLAPPGLRLTTGNSFTVAVGVERILAACAEATLRRDNGLTLAVVGATGNIGSALIRYLLQRAHSFVRVVLIARDRRRLQRLADDLAVAHPELAIEISTNLMSVHGTDVIAITTGTNEPLLYPHHIDCGRRVIIADLSAPEAVSRLARKLENLSIIPLAGAVAIPGEPDFVLGANIPEGTAYCCAAEAMVLGLAPTSVADSLQLTGPVRVENVVTLAALAHEYGFLAAAQAPVKLWQGTA